MASALLWSVMAMYSRPRRCAASAIAVRSSRPSVSVVCMCRSPRRSARVMSCRQRSAASGLDFPAVLAQLGLDPVHAQGSVDPFLRLSRHPAVIVDPEQAVLIELESELHRTVPHDDVVRLRACEVLHRCPATLERHEAQVGLISTS